jgi:hypothetical protein
MNHGFRVFAHLAAFAFVAACGGSSPLDLFSGPGSQGSSSSSSGSSGSSGNTPPPMMTDAGPKPVDAGMPPVVVDAAPPADPDQNRVGCNVDSSDNPKYCGAAEVCCAQRPQNSSMFDVFECRTAGTCATNLRTAEFACDDKRDCTGARICCATYQILQASGAGVYIKSACTEASQCNKRVANNIFVQFCEEANPVANECPSGLTCKTSDNVAGYGFCE